MVVAKCIPALLSRTFMSNRWTPAIGELCWEKLSISDDMAVSCFHTLLGNRAPPAAIQFLMKKAGLVFVEAELLKLFSSMQLQDHPETALSILDSLEPGPTLSIMRQALLSFLDHDHASSAAHIRRALPHGLIIQKKLFFGHLFVPWFVRVSI